jgi:hypothetical protein
MLGRLELGFAPGELLEESGIGIYVYYDFHVERANGILPEIAWAGGRHPSYALNSEGVPERKGLFDDTHPWRSRFFWFLGKSYILRGRMHLVAPRLRKHYELTCAIIRESNRRFEALHKGNEFFVALPEGELLKHDSSMRRECFEKYKIKIIDIPFPSDKRLEDLTYAGDFHWNREGAKWIAGELVNYFKNRSGG